MLNRIRACLAARKDHWQVWWETESIKGRICSLSEVIQHMDRLDRSRRDLAKAEESLRFFDWLVYIVALEVAKRKWAKEAECVAAKP